GVLHGLQPGQALFQGPGFVRQGAYRGRVCARDRGACVRHLGAAADARPRDSGLRHGGDPPRRPDGLGTQSRPAALRRAQGLRLGPDRLDVPRQRSGAAAGAQHGAALRRRAARPLCGGCADDRRLLCYRRLRDPERDVRHLADARLWRRGLCLQEDRHSARSVHARAGARKPRRGRVPPVDDRRSRRCARVLVQRAGRVDHHARAGLALLASDLADHGVRDVAQVSGPLAGIKVLELAQIMAGPTCGLMLADLGADVIKVERGPGGDDTRMMNRPSVRGEPAPLITMNRNKRGIALNLKLPAAQEALKRMVARADVLTENYRKGTMEKLGMGYEALKALNPRLIYCSISGYGRTGPYADKGGYDL